MNNFEVGDRVTINSPSAFAKLHGKKATIISRSTQGFNVELFTEQGKVAHVDLLPSQMIKTIMVRDPALTNFIDHTLPELTKEAATEYDAEQDRIANEVNHDTQLFKKGIQEGYITGYYQGYVEGYRAAMADVQAIFQANGIMQPDVPGEPNVDSNK